MEWLRDNWLKVHLAISPLGTLLVTWVLVATISRGQWWENAETLELTGQAIPLGGVLYGSGILATEVLFRMLWALAQRQREIDRARREGVEEGREKGREEGREETIRRLLERGVDLPAEVLKDLEESTPR